jgi:hypothetical protein
MKLSEQEDELRKEYEIMIKTNSEYLVQIIKKSFYKFDKYTYCFVMEYCQVFLFNHKLASILI